MRGVVRGWSRTRPDVFSPERVSDDHRLISSTAHEFMTNEVMPDDRSPRGEGLGARPRARAPVRELGLIGTDVPEDVRRRRPRQGVVDHRRRVGRAQRVVRSDVRRQTGLTDHADPLLRHRRAESAIPAAPRRARSSGPTRSANPAPVPTRSAPAPRRAPARRQLRPQRREDVDHQRRLRRPLHRLREGRRRAVHRVHRRARRSPASRAARKSTRWACTARRRRR
jgi:hypothetical protein